MKNGRIADKMQEVSMGECKKQRSKGMEKRTEHHKFYFADFLREEQWLADKNKEGWRLVDTDGATYEFEECPKEDWVYKTEDIKKEDDPNTFLDKFQEKGWKFICRSNERAYFKKRRIGKEVDISVFTDEDTRLAYSKKVYMNHMFKMIPAYILIAIYLYILLFTKIMRNFGEIGFGIFSTIGFMAIIALSVGVGVHLSERKRWKKVTEEFKSPERKEMTLEEALKQMDEKEDER